MWPIGANVWIATSLDGRDSVERLSTLDDLTAMSGRDHNPPDVEEVFAFEVPVDRDEMTALITQGRLHAQRQRREDEVFEDDGLMPVDWDGHALGVPVPGRLSALRHRLVSKRPVASHRVRVAPAFANAAVPAGLPGGPDVFRSKGN